MFGRPPMRNAIARRKSESRDLRSYRGGARVVVRAEPECRRAEPGRRHSGPGSESRTQAEQWHWQLAIGRPASAATLPAGGQRPSRGCAKPRSAAQFRARAVGCQRGVWAPAPAGAARSRLGPGRVPPAIGPHRDLTDLGTGTAGQGQLACAPNLSGPESESPGAAALGFSCSDAPLS